MESTLSSGELVTQFRKKFGIRGDTNLSLESVIVPVAEMVGLDEAPYNSKGGGIFGLAAGPVLAKYGYTGIRPAPLAPDNYRAVIRYVVIANDGGAGYTAVVKLADSAAMDAVLVGPAVSIITGTWDTPGPQRPSKRPLMQSYSTNSATYFGADGIIVQVPAGQCVTVPGPFVLAPGNTAFVVCNTQNASIIGSWYWDEYLVG